MMSEVSKVKVNSRWERSIVKRKVSIAPMMEITDRHFRAFMRCITSQTTLYTEMVTTGALIHGDRERFLKYGEKEHPIALQIGGSSPKDCAQSAKLGETWGYDEINLNVGCPSDRVQEGKIGACLMAEPNLVKDVLTSMMEATSVPISIKTRLGIDEQDSMEDFQRFMDTILKSGVRLVTLHARKAWLKGLSPKQNRDVPPLWYERVYQFKEAFPEITVEINGGIKTHSDCHEHLKHVDAVMIGRAANDRPWWFHEFDEDLYKDSPPSQTRSEALSLYAEHVEKERVWGTPNRVLLHPLLNLFQGVRGAKPWRQLVSANKMDPDQQWAELHALAQGIESELGR